MSDKRKERKELLIGVWCNKREQEKLNKLKEKYNIRRNPQMFRQLLREKRL